MNDRVLIEEWQELVRSTPTSVPPRRDDPSWHEWAERQTVLNLRAAMARRRASLQPPPPPPPALRLVRSHAQIRIHPENVKALTG